MSVLVGLLLVAAYLVASAGLSVAPGPAGAIPADEVVGLTPMAIGLPAIVLGGVLLAMIWYFTVGTATRRDLRLIFDPAGADAIEPWMIEQVQLRVALGSTAFAPVTEWGARVGSEATVAVRSIPLLGGAVASAFSRGVREYRGAPPPGPVPGPAHHEDAEPPTLDWPAEPPTIDWPADAPTLDSPRWRPVPGWGLPNVTRSVLTPVGTSQGTRPGNLRDEREWPGDRNEQRAATRARSTNSRQGDFPSRSPYPELVLVNGDEPTWAPTMADEPSPPLPRRNTGR
jgi:hypothetical protein